MTFEKTEGEGGIILSINAFTNETISDSLRELDILIDSDPQKITNKELFQNVNNILVKRGFMLLSNHLMIENRQDVILSIWINFHLNNFIYDTKSFLDSVAVTLNQYYQIGFSKGDIELSSDRFLNELQKKNSSLFNQIKNHKKWIDEVVDWRDKLIHRFTTLIAHISNDPPVGNLSDDSIKQLPVKMPIKPLPLLDVLSKTDKIKKEHGEAFQDPIDFCRNWLQCSKTIMEIVVNSLVIDLKAKTK